MHANYFVNTGGAKMSKSQGAVVSPSDLAKVHGPDALRYFLLREVAWGADGEFSLERFEERTAADLANTLGNLLHRTLTMVEKYFSGFVPDVGGPDTMQPALVEFGRQVRSLRAAAAEAWCIQQLSVPISGLGPLRNEPFWIRLDAQIVNGQNNAREDEGLTLRGIIDTLSRRQASAKTSHSAEGGPFRVRP